MYKLSAKSPLVTGLATLIAVTMLALASVWAINLFLQENNKLQQTESSNLSQPSIRINNKNTDYRKLAKLHLFGKEEPKITKNPQIKEVIKAPETRLNLKLIGVLFEQNKDNGLAIILESGKPQKTFSKGDKLYGDATVHTVEKDRVILKRNGRHETLSLIKPDLRTLALSGKNKDASKNDRRTQNNRIKLSPSIRRSNDNLPTSRQRPKIVQGQGRTI